MDPRVLLRKAKQRGERRPTCERSPASQGRDKRCCEKIAKIGRNVAGFCCNETMRILQFSLKVLLLYFPHRAAQKFFLGLPAFGFQDF